MSHGTPNTAANATSHQTVSASVNILAQSPQNIVSGIDALGITAEPWPWQSAAITDFNNVASPGSQLASAWARCSGDDCPTPNGYYVVVYEDLADGSTTYINSSNLETPFKVVEAGNVVQNSSLAILPQSDLNVPSNGVTRLVLMTEGLTSSDSGVADSVSYITDHWQSSDPPLGNMKLQLPSPRLQFAMSTLDNFNSPVYLALLPDGTVTGRVWRAGIEKYIGIATVEFRGGPSSAMNFSSIAATEEAMFYGISNDQIYEYSINNTDPSKFDFVGTVYP
ncbi:hypothetical protein F4808DRAFT_430868 [Astrocystis sublimbata]|nr:hypothetical protein F4808DRAFT_430868 [Astrocystis sublimbata]